MLLSGDIKNNRIAWLLAFCATVLVAVFALSGHARAAGYDCPTQPIDGYAGIDRTNPSQCFESGISAELCARAPGSTYDTSFGQHTCIFTPQAPRPAPPPVTTAVTPPKPHPAPPAPAPIATRPPPTPAVAAHASTPSAPAQAADPFSQEETDKFESEAQVYRANMGYWFPDKSDPTPVASATPDELQSSVDVPLQCVEIKSTETNVHCSGSEGPMMWSNAVKMNNGPSCGYSSFDLHYSEPIMDPAFAKTGETYSVYRHFNDIFGLETCGGPAKLSGVSALRMDALNQADLRSTPFIPPKGVNPFMSPPPGASQKATADIPPSILGRCNDTNSDCMTMVQQFRALFGAGQ